MVIRVGISRIKEILLHHELHQEKTYMVNISQLDTRRYLLKSAHSPILLHHFKLMQLHLNNFISHQIITACYSSAFQVLKELHLWARAIFNLSFSDLRCASAGPLCDAFSSSVPFTLDARVEDGVSRPDSCSTTQKWTLDISCNTTTPISL